MLVCLLCCFLIFYVIHFHLCASFFSDMAGSYRVATLLWKFLVCSLFCCVLVYTAMVGGKTNFPCSAKKWINKKTIDLPTICIGWVFPLTWSGLNFYVLGPKTWDSSSKATYIVLFPDLTRRSKSKYLNIYLFVTFRVLWNRCLGFPGGPGGFTKLWEASRIHFHLSWYLLVPGITSYGPKPFCFLAE